MQMLPVAAMAAVVAGLLAAIGTQPGAGRAAAGAAVASSTTTTASKVQVAQAGTPAASAPSAAASFSPEQKQAIEKIIRDYLVEHPEVMAEAQAAFEAKQELMRAERMKLAIEQNASRLFKSTSAPFAGNPNGDITIVEFFDYNCGYCKRALGDVARIVDSDKKVKFVFKELPIFGRDSEAAARVAIAAKKQNKYWDVHSALLKLRGKANEAKALELAQAAGLDMARLKKDMVSEEVSKEIADVRTLAESMGIQGTPHFFVGDRMIPGAPENLFEVMSKHIADIRGSGGCKVC